MDLLDYNQNTLDELNEFILEGKNCCVVNPCGSGKTIVMAKFIEQHPNKTFTILTKQLNAKQYYLKNDIIRNANVNIITYSKMFTDFKNDALDSKYNVDYLLLDEAHYIGAPNWKNAFLAILTKYNPYYIGFTATPQRFEDQDSDNTIVKEYFDNNSAGNYSTKDLQKRGYLVEPEYVLSIYNMKTTIESKIDKVINSNLEASVQENYIEQLDEILKDWKNNKSPYQILRQYLPKYMYKESCNRILVYVSNINEIPEKSKVINSIIKGIFPNKKIKSYAYTYKQNEKVLHDFLVDDDNYIKILYSIDKIMETIHIDDLRILLMLRPSISNRIITQQFGRVNNIRNKHKPLIIDMVDNLSNIGRINREHYENIVGASNFILELPTLYKTYDLFNTIDNSINAYYYKYRGITATLRDICYIYLRNVKRVKELLDDGYSLEDAMDKVPINKYSTKYTFDNVYNIEDGFTLSKEQQEYAEENLYIVTNLTKRYKLKADDTSILNIYYLYYVYNSYKFTNTYRQKQYVASQTRRAALLILKHNFILSLNKSNNIEDMLENELAYNLLMYNDTDVIEYFKDCVNYNELMAICLYFGIKDECVDGYDIPDDGMTLQEIGNIFNVTRESIRNRLNNAYRKVRRRYKRQLLDLYDEICYQKNNYSIYNKDEL